MDCEDETQKNRFCGEDRNKSKQQVISIFSVENCSAIASHPVVKTLWIHLSIYDSNKGISDWFTINSHVHAANCLIVWKFTLMRCTILYCYTVFFKFSSFHEIISLNSLTVSTTQLVHKWCCKSWDNYPKLAHSYRSRHDWLQHVVALSVYWKHLLFELQKWW